MRRDDHGERARRRALRDQLVAQGLDTPDNVAQAFLGEWNNLTPLAAYRLANDLTQTEAAERYNRHAGYQRGDPRELTRKDISKIELWPQQAGLVRRPTAGELIVLAAVYRASASARLVAPGNWELLDPPDRIALRSSAGALPAVRAAGTVETGRANLGDYSQAHESTRDYAGTGHGLAGVERLIVMTAHETAAYGDHPSNIGPLTVDQLRSDVGRLAGMHANTPRIEVFSQGRFLRDRIFELLDGRQRAAETRDLNFLAAAVLGMLAESSHNFGNRVAAMTHLRTGLFCAEEAGYPPLLAWLRAKQSLVAFYDGRPAQAREYVRRGEQHAGSGTVAAYLAASEARAASKLGDDTGARATVRQAEELRAQVIPDDLDRLGGLLTFPEPKQHFYAAGAYLGVRDAALCVTEEAMSVEQYQNGPDDQRAYDNEAQAQADAAAAHLMAGDLDAAREAAQFVFGIAPELRIDPVDLRLRHLHRRLTTPDIRTAPAAVELRDQIESFLASPVPTLAQP